MSSPNSRIHVVGESPIERLPSELLHKIFTSVSSKTELERHNSLLPHLPVDPNTKTQVPSCLLPCLLTSRTLLGMALPVMYRSVEIPQISTFNSILFQITHQLHLGSSVRTLDLSGFCSSTGVQEGSFNPILETLSCTPSLREMRVNKHMEHYLNHEVLEKLFCNLSFLETLHLSGCSSSTFINACSTLVDQNQPVTKSIRSLTFAGCTDIPPDFFQWLLPQLPSLQYLDVLDTQITSAALSGIPDTAQLTHLNIGHCYALKGSQLVDFLLNHTSTRQLVYMNMEVNPGIEYQIFNGNDISHFLPQLPSTLRILNLKNTAMTSTHAPLLRKPSAHLEEISFGSNLRFQDIENLFLDPVTPADSNPELDPQEENVPEVEAKYQAVLSLMEETIAICKLRQRINCCPDTRSNTISTLRYLDISSLPVVEQGKLRSSILLGSQSRPLEIIEVSEEVRWRYAVLPKLCKAVGWEFGSGGRRCWLRRRHLR